MTAFTRCEKGLSSTGSVVCGYRSQQSQDEERGGKGATGITVICTETKVEREAYLATAEDLIAGQVEDVHDELRHSIPANPEEDILPVLDEEQTVAFEPF